ncbi:MAG: hypothetical protein Q8P49_04680 [Candidatus Liptonbacteria bacterium]|nr:hypothetical protein [Candidatus Liptonbacteria bacterium]
MDECLSFNVNDEVEVRLTEAGKRIYRQHHGEISRKASWNIAIREPQEQEGWSCFQMWVLMEIFGPHMHMGTPEAPFEENEIRLKSKLAVPAVAPKE